MLAHPPATAWPDYSRFIAPAQSHPLLAKSPAWLKPVYSPSVELSLGFGPYVATLTIHGIGDARWLRSIGVPILSAHRSGATVVVNRLQLERTALRGMFPTHLEYVSELSGGADASGRRLADTGRLSSRARELVTTSRLLAQAAPVVDDDCGAIPSDPNVPCLTPQERQAWCLTPGTNQSNPFNAPWTDDEQVQGIKDWLAHKLLNRLAPEQPFKSFSLLGPDEPCTESFGSGVPDAVRLLLGLSPKPSDGSSANDRYTDAQKLFGYGPSYSDVPAFIDRCPCTSPQDVTPPYDSPFVAALPDPEISVDPNSINVTPSEVITSGTVKGSTSGTSYAQAETKESSYSETDTKTWNSWQEVSQALTTTVPGQSSASQRRARLERELLRVTAKWGSAGSNAQERRRLFLRASAIERQVTGDQFWGAVDVVGGIGTIAGGCVLPAAATSETGFWGAVACVATVPAGVSEIHNGFEELTDSNSQSPNSVKPQQIYNTTNNYGLSSRQMSGISTNLNQGFSGLANSIDGVSYEIGQQGALMSQGLQDVAYAIDAPKLTVTNSSGQSVGGSLATTNEVSQSETVTNTNSYFTNQEWSQATAQNTSQAATLSFSFTVTNDGSDVLKDMNSLVFNVYLGNDPTPILSKDALQFTKGDLQDLLPGQSHTYSTDDGSSQINLTLDQFQRIDEGEPVHIKLESWSSAAPADGSLDDQALIQQAEADGVTVQTDDGSVDPSSAPTFNSYVIPYFRAEDVFTAISRFFRQYAANLVTGLPNSISIPQYTQPGGEYNSDQQPPPWMAQPANSRSWWTIYSTQPNASGAPLSQIPAEHGSTILIRFDRDSDADGYSDRLEWAYGTDPYNPASHPSPDLGAGYTCGSPGTKLTVGTTVTCKLALRNTGTFPALGVSADMYAPDSSTTVTNDVVGGNGVVGCPTVVTLPAGCQGSNVSVGQPDLSAWSSSTSVPLLSGSFTGTAAQTYTFSVAGAGTVGESGATVSWTSTDLSGNQTGSGSIDLGGSYNPGPTSWNALSDNLGVQVAFLPGTLVAGDTFSVHVYPPGGTVAVGSFIDGPSAWTSGSSAVTPYVSGSYTGDDNRLYTFTVPQNEKVGESGSTLTWSCLSIPVPPATPRQPCSGQASGSVDIGSSYQSPLPRVLGDNLGVQIGLSTGTLVGGDKFTVEAFTAGDTFSYKINSVPFTPPVILVHYSDEQGAHRFLIPTPPNSSPSYPSTLRSLASAWAAPSGDTMLQNPGVHIVTSGPVSASSANSVNLVVDSPSAAPIQGGKLEADITSSPPNQTGGSTLISSATCGNNVVTILAPNAFQAGQTVTITGVTPSDYDGTYTVGASPTSSQFTYTLPSCPGAPYKANTGTFTPGGVVCHIEQQENLQPGPTVQALTFSTTNFSTSKCLAAPPSGQVRPNYYPAGDNILSVTWTDSYGNIIDSTARPFGTFGKDPVPTLNTTVTSLNIGSVTQGALVPETIPIVNTGLVPLHINISSTDPNISFTDGNGNSLTNPTSILTVAPGGTQNIKATVDTGTEGQTTLTHPMTLLSPIVVRSDDPGHSVTGAIMTGTINPPGNVQANAFAVPNHPWDRLVHVYGAVSQGTPLTFSDSMEPDDATAQPCFVYRPDGSRAGVGQACSDFGQSQVSSDLFGNGQDGDVEISSDGQKPNCAQGGADGSLCDLDTVRDVVNSGSQGSTTLNVTMVAGQFAPKDLVLIHQTQGSGAGAWEPNHVQSVSNPTGSGAGSGTLLLTSALQNNYVSDSGSDHAQVVLVPQYQNLTIDPGVTVAPQPWNGSVGGIEAIAARQGLSNEGQISANGVSQTDTSYPNPVVANGGGFRGGTVEANQHAGFQGEGLTGPGAQGNTSANGNGGGGGAWALYGPDHSRSNAGGGGGGENGGGAAPGGASPEGIPGGSPGSLAGSNTLSLISLGGGGGGGGSVDNSLGGQGGNGGGVILLYAANVVQAGAITANGGAGQQISNSGGGGGAGGSVLLTGNFGVASVAGLEAEGGPGGPGSSGSATGAGGAGGNGRIALSYCASVPAGSTAPPAYEQRAPCYLASEASPPAVNFTVPDNVTNGQDYTMQFGHVLSFNGSNGPITTYARVAPSYYTAATMDALLTNIAGSVSDVSVDVGATGTPQCSDAATYGQSVKATLVDADGNPCDLAAAFNAYIASYMKANPSATYVDVPIQVSLRGQGNVILTDLSLTPGSSADLAVSSSDISLGCPGASTCPATEGQTVPVNLTVHNNGSQDASDVVVGYYVGDPTSTENPGVLVGTSFIPTVSAGGSPKKTSFGWDTTDFAGKDTLYAVVDPQQAQGESNYADKTASITTTVLSKPPTSTVITVTAPNGTMTYGQAVPSLAATYSGFNAGDTPANTLTGSPACTTTATSTSPTGAYTTTCTNGSLAVVAGKNYKLDFASGTLTILPASLTVTASSPTITYGQAIPSITPTYTGLVNGDAAPKTPPACSTAAGAAGTTAAAGIHETNCSGASDPNYTIAYTSGTLTIQPAPLTIAASSPTITYGQPIPPITPGYKGLVNGDTAPKTPPACSTTAGATGATAAAGSYKTTCSGASDPNYTIAYTSGTLTVQPAPLTITAGSPTITYGQAIPPITPSYKGLVNGDPSPKTPPACSTTAGATGTTAAAGSYKTTCSGASDPNYTIAYTSGTLTVQPAPLTITASSPTITYGQGVPPITPSYKGLVNGDTAPKTPPTCATTAGKAGAPVDAGKYRISCTGASDPNYDITYLPGGLTVLPAKLTVTASSPPAINYPEPIPAINPILTGLKWADKGTKTMPTCSTTAGKQGQLAPAATYVTQCSGASDPNYTISYVNGALTINLGEPVISYLGPMAFKRGATALVRISLNADTKTKIPISGRTLSVRLGSGADSTSCKTSKTSSAGTASCRMARVTLTAGRQPIKVVFGGDPKGSSYDYAAKTWSGKVRVVD